MPNPVSRTTAKSVPSGAINSKGGKFVEAMRKLAKKRSKSRSKSPLQVGNVLTKKALPKGKANFDSKIVKKDDGKAFAPIRPEKDNLNPKQQGAKK